MKGIESAITSNYEESKDFNPDRARGTCQWVLKNHKYACWRQAKKDDLLWISADPGCGKSVLARSLIDHEFQNLTMNTTCYFFFKDDNENQDNLASALCAILHQLFSKQPQLIKYAIPSWDQNGSNLRVEVRELWKILLSATASKDANPGALSFSCSGQRRER